MTRAQKRKRAKLVACALALFWGLALGHSVVFAHIALLRSQPRADERLREPPKQVELWFTEAIRHDFTVIEVIDGQGRRVDRGEIRLSEEGRKAQVELGDLAPGRYAVVWRALSADDHPVRGRFAFAVIAAGTVPSPEPEPGAQVTTQAEQETLPPEPEQPPLLSGEETPTAGREQERAPSLTWADSLVRWLAYVTMMTLFGGFAFRLFVLGPALRRIDAGAAEIYRSASDRRAIRLLWPSLILLITASMVALVFQTAAVFARPLREALAPALLSQVLTRTDFGVSWALQFTSAVLLFLIVGVITLLSKQSPPSKSAGWWWLSGFAASALLLLAPSWTGHAAAAVKEYRFAVIADWLHLIAGGFWVGGLFHLTLNGLPTLRFLEKNWRAPALRRLLQSFTRMAVPGVALLALAGGYNAWVQVGSWQALRNSLYGQTLLLKLTLVVAMLVLGTANSLRFGREVMRTENSSEPGAQSLRSVSALERSVIAEAALGILVLLVTAALVFISPARGGN